MLQDIGQFGFYITNVCNFNCDNCSYLNNYSIKGHQLWQDNEETCRQWAERVNPTRIIIGGGEPMLNPDFIKWINGLATLWPYAEIRIFTNGSCFDRWPNLYDELVQYHGRVNISISGHNEHKKIHEIQVIKSFLRGKITEEKQHHRNLRVWAWKKIYNDIKDVSCHEINSLNDYHNLPDYIKKEIEELHKVDINTYVDYDEPVDDYEVYTDENNIRIGWARWDEFGTAAVKFDPVTQSMTLHNSDPDRAVSICHGGHCAHIKDGKLYKCQVMSNLPDMFEQKFPFNISQEDKDLILSYEPALPTWNSDKLNNFFQRLKNRDPIPQCKFCPEQKIYTKIYAGTKKIKVIKLKSNATLD